MDNILTDRDTEPNQVSRYFLEVSYKGTRYKGFQIQSEDITIQSEVEKALNILLKQKIHLTGSSRTDAGVHALQNFFHFDTGQILHHKLLYNLNALLPTDIVAKGLYKVDNNAHSRFDALSREYKYFIYQQKDPFLRETACYYPFAMDIEQLQNAAKLILAYTDFTSFSKRNTQVKTFNCNILLSEWTIENNCFVYHVKANRFLRGMVRGLVGTMLKVGRGTISLEQFRKIIESKNCANADFSAPAHGLFLVKVEYKNTLEMEAGLPS